MRRLIAATCSAGVAVVVASPAIAGAPPPTVPSDAAIAQYIEAVPSATGPVPIGEAASPASGAALPTAVRAKVERTAGVDAPALLDLAQDPRFGARPESRAAPLERSLGSAPTLLPQSHASPSSRRPARRRPARSPRRPRRPVPAGSCSSPSCSSRSRRRASLPGRRGASGPRGVRSDRHDGSGLRASLRGNWRYEVSVIVRARARE